MSQTSTEPPKGVTAHAIIRCAAAVRGALSGVSGTPAWSMSSTEQRAALVDLARAESQLTELRLRVLAAGDKNQIGDDTGASSAAAWIAHRTQQTRVQAHADLRLAQNLDGAFEATRVALGEGLVDEAQARVIVNAIEDLPDTVEAADRDAPRLT